MLVQTLGSEESSPLLPSSEIQNEHGKNSRKFGSLFKDTLSILVAVVSLSAGLIYSQWYQEEKCPNDPELSCRGPILLSLRPLGIAASKLLPFASPLDTKPSGKEFSLTVLLWFGSTIALAVLVSKRDCAGLVLFCLWAGGVIGLVLGCVDCMITGTWTKIRSANLAFVCAPLGLCVARLLIMIFGEDTISRKMKLFERTMR